MDKGDMLILKTLQSEGYTFYLSSSTNNADDLGFLTPPPIVLRYTPPPQIGVSHEAVIKEIISIAWQYRMLWLREQEARTYLQWVHENQDIIESSRNALTEILGLTKIAESNSYSEIATIARKTLDEME